MQMFFWKYKNGRELNRFVPEIDIVKKDYGEENVKSLK